MFWFVGFVFGGVGAGVFIFLHWLLITGQNGALCEELWSMLCYIVEYKLVTFCSFLQVKFTIFFKSRAVFLKPHDAFLCKTSSGPFWAVRKYLFSVLLTTSVIYREIWAATLIYFHMQREQNVGPDLFTKLDFSTQTSHQRCLWGGAVLKGGSWDQAVQVS